MTQYSTLWAAYKLRWNRRRLLARAWRKRRQLSAIVDRTKSVKQNDILVFCTFRNEADRLPYFLNYYRALGVKHFLMVDNGSDDGSLEFLQDQPDVSLWHTRHSYKLSRFGMDWLTWLQIKHAVGHWTLTIDADELLIYPDFDNAPLPKLTAWMDTQKIPALGVTMLDLYPKGPLGAQEYQAGQDPLDVVSWFDADGYRSQIQPKLQSLWIQGGPRDRMFFSSQPERAPTLNKIPLVKWQRGYAYVTSTHQLLPRRLNHVFSQHGGNPMTGVLLHTKFLPSIVQKSGEEKHRAEHFANSDLYDQYYDALVENPTLWTRTSVRYTSWRDVEAAGLMQKGNWSP
jgi:hypothetical protein